MYNHEQILFRVFIDTSRPLMILTVPSWCFYNHEWCQPFSGLWHISSKDIIHSGHTNPDNTMVYWLTEIHRHVDLYVFFVFLFHILPTWALPAIHHQSIPRWDVVTACVSLPTHIHPSIHVYMSHMHICKLLIMHKSCQEICDMCARTIACSP